MTRTMSNEVRVDLIIDLNAPEGNEFGEVYSAEITLCGIKTNAELARDGLDLRRFFSGWKQVASHLSDNVCTGEVEREGSFLWLSYVRAG